MSIQGEEAVAIPQENVQLMAVPESERATMLPSTNVLERLMMISNALSRSGMPLPKNCRTPESIFAKLLIGWEHGLGPMTALNEIHNIDGKMSLPESIKVGIIRTCGIGKVDVKELDDKHCVVEVRRNDWPKSRWETITWTWEDSVRARIHEKDTHKKYPRAMMLARATGLAIHTHFQEVFMGMPYSPEELGAEVDEAGRPIMTEFEKPSGPAAPPPPINVEARLVSVETPVPGPVAPPVQAPSTLVTPAAPAAPVAPVTSTAAKDPVVEARELADGLQIVKEHRAAIFERHGSNVAAYLQYLKSIDTLRRVRVHLGVTDMQYGTAIDRRGVSRDYELPPEVVSEMLDKMFTHLTPSDREKLGIASPNPFAPASPTPPGG